MTVRAILDAKGRQVASVGPESTVANAINFLSERHIGSLLVMSGGKLEGILSERDIVRELGKRGADLLQEKVSNVMTAKVLTCNRSDTISHIMEMMTNGKFRHVPVVEDGQVIGVISIGDVVKHRVAEFENEREALTDYIKTA
jgi:CBS domain-containing protein